MLTGVHKATSSLFSQLTKITSPSITLRLKGAYTKLKAFFQVSTSNLFNIVRNIKNLINNEINNYIITLVKHQDRLPHNIRELEFNDIIRDLLAAAKALAPPYSSLGLAALTSSSFRLSLSLRGYCHTLYHIVLFHRLSCDSCSACLLPTVYLGKYASQISYIK